ncbi:MAG: hypothetical protein KF777_17915 [Planctomycetaceae bacterium]|nr:hypothetical protein [Planctomycetaceae bacterium]
MSKKRGGWDLNVPLRRPALALCKAIALVLPLLSLLPLWHYSYDFVGQHLIRILTHLAAFALACLCQSSRYGWTIPSAIIGFCASPFAPPGAVSNAPDYELNTMWSYTILGLIVGALLDLEFRSRQRQAAMSETLVDEIVKIPILSDASRKRRPGRHLCLLLQGLALVVAIRYFLAGITDPKYVAYAPVFTLLRAALVVQALACLCLRTGWTGPAMIVGFIVPWMIAPPVDPNSYYVTRDQVTGCQAGFFFGALLDFAWHNFVQSPAPATSDETEVTNAATEDDRM